MLPLQSLLTAVALAALMVAPAAADDKPKPEPKGDVRKLHTGFTFTEGPAADSAGNIYFTDVRQSKIHKVDTKGELSTFMEDTAGCNGLMFDPKGRLIACQGGKGRVIAIDVDTKKVLVLADQYNGKRFNAPNDLAVDKQGGVYFTDPARRMGESPQDKQGVYYVTPEGKVTRLLDDLERPNGILLAPDDKSLYVLLSGRPALMAYPVEKPGELGKGKELGKVERGGDGLTVDVHGNLYLTQPSLGLIKIMAPDGTDLGEVKVPENPSNCAFGGPEMKTLYVTARASIYAVDLNVAGHRVVPGEKK
jgi:gluconolactonase